MHHIENRVHQRVQCFNFPFERAFIPIWVFASFGGVAGLVVNLSFSGIQILTESNEKLANQLYDIVFVDEDDNEISNSAVCQARHVWTDKTSTLYNTSGFSFVGDVESAIRSQFNKFHYTSHPYLRCELRETFARVLN